MALSLTSRFGYIVINFDALNGQPGSLYYELTDGTSEYLSLWEGYTVIANYPAVVGPLTVLQNIYASADGFLDADGNSIAVTVTQFPHGTTPESLSDHNYWNPLDVGSWARREFRLQMLRHLSAGNNEDRALAAWVMNFGLRFGDVEVEGTVNQNLGEVVNVRQVATQAFEFSLFYDIEDRVTYPDFHQQLKNKAFLAWLESIRQGSPVVALRFYGLGIFI